MAKNDAETTEFVVKNCNATFPKEFLERLGSNSQKSRLSTKYEMIEKAIITEFNAKKIEYTQDKINECTSKAYIYAKMVSGKFTEIRPKVDSTQILGYIIKNYEDGYKYILEAIFMKLGISGISSYVKGKIEGNIFYTKISEVTNSKPSVIKRSENFNVKSNIARITKIQNLVFEIGIRQEEGKYLDSRLKVKKIEQKNSKNLFAIIKEVNTNNKQIKIKNV